MSGAIIELFLSSDTNYSSSHSIRHFLLYTLEGKKGISHLSHECYSVFSTLSFSLYIMYVLRQTWVRYFYKSIRYKIQDTSRKKYLDTDTRYFGNFVLQIHDTIYCIKDTFLKSIMIQDTRYFLDKFFVSRCRYKIF